MHHQPNGGGTLTLNGGGAGGLHSSSNYAVNTVVVGGGGGGGSSRGSSEGNVAMGAHNGVGAGATRGSQVCYENMKETCGRVLTNLVPLCSPFLIPGRPLDLGAESLFLPAPPQLGGRGREREVAQGEGLPIRHLGLRGR